MATVYKPGGSKNRKANYQIMYFDEYGKRRKVSAKTTDRAAAQRLANRLESEAMLRREGIIDIEQETVAKESRRPISEHLEAFRAKMVAAARTEQHIRETLRYVSEVCDSCSFGAPVEITAEKVNRFIAGLLERGLSARTAQAYFVAFRSFSKWLCSHDRLAKDPIAMLKAPRPSAARRKRRDMLRPEEWALLSAWLRHDDKTSYGMPPDERRLLYETALQTGLRARELRSLVRTDLSLDVAPPSIRISADRTKNKTAAVQFVRRELAIELLQHVANKLPNARVFAMPHRSNIARMLLADLRRARRPGSPQSRVRQGGLTGRARTSCRPNATTASSSIFTAYATRAAAGCCWRGLTCSPCSA